MDVAVKRPVMGAGRNELRNGGSRSMSIASMCESDTTERTSLDRMDGDDATSYSSGITIDDPDVRIAAEALNGLKAAESSSGGHPPLALPLPRPPAPLPPPASANPFVSSARWAYENSKSYSPRFKYGAEMVEQYARRFERRRSSSSGRWQSVLVGAGVALSEESLKSLRYCLKWLRYANRMLARNVESLQVLLSQPVSSQTSPRVAAIKQDVINTLRKVINIVSTYAGSALPEPARSRVRGYMLSLPGRWTAANPPSGTLDEKKQHHDEKEEAGRVLTLAGEGLEMFKNVTLAVGETLEAAESWCDAFGKRHETQLHAEMLENGSAQNGSAVVEEAIESDEMDTK